MFWHSDKNNTALETSIFSSFGVVKKQGLKAQNQQEYLDFSAKQVLER